MRWPFSYLTTSASFTAVVLIAVMAIAAPVEAEESSASVDFDLDVKPIFAKHCISCHGAKKQEASLRLDSGMGITAGGDSGPAIKAGKPTESLLVQRLLGAEGEERMPPEGPGLAATEIATVRHWIEQGGITPRDDVAEKVRIDHWAFRRPVRPELPVTKNFEWSRNSIDSFILERLEKKQIGPAAQADRATLLRRASLDLTGLPPSPDEVEAFLRDERPDAYERVIDRLLASPAYGERWGRLWLDQARYADSNGYTRDFGREIWRYREWVIQAFNHDLPFDEFTIQQLAGDMLPGATNEQLVATGFHRNTLVNEEGGTDQEQFRVDAVADRVATTGQVWLGLTIGCARCHNHKYDPISQREFYQFFAFLNNCDEPTLEVPSQLNLEHGDLEKRTAIREQIVTLEKEVETKRPQFEAKQQEWEKTVTPEQRSRLPGPVQVAYDVAFEKRDTANKKMVEDFYRQTPEARKEFPQLDEIATLRAAEPKIPKTMILREREKSRETHIHKRGDFLNLGVKVEPAFPAALHLPMSPRPASGVTTSSLSRLDLARWLVDPANPLTARVTMNRHWQQLFGRGLVETEDDFGLQGSRPTHPELLDWLAVEFQGSGVGGQESGENVLAWSMKRMQRCLVTSATYRQSSRARPDLAEVDPRNELLARQSRLRVDAEIVRDIALSAAGQLTHVLGGKSVMPPQPEGVYAFTQDPKPWKTETDGQRYRRGMYTFFWRSLPYPMLTTFDAPTANVTCTRRIRSNTPLQSLTLANDAAFVECARSLGARILRESSGGIDQQARYAFRVCLGRDPRERELQRFVDLVNQQRSAFAADDGAAKEMIAGPVGNDLPLADFAAWIAACRVLLNLDEFITRE